MIGDEGVRHSAAKCPPAHFPARTVKRRLRLRNLHLRGGESSTLRTPSSGKDRATLEAELVGKCRRLIDSLNLGQFATAHGSPTAGIGRHRCFWTN